MHFVNAPSLPSPTIVRLPWPYRYSWKGSAQDCQCFGVVGKVHQRKREDDGAVSLTRLSFPCEYPELVTDIFGTLSSSHRMEGLVLISESLSGPQHRPVYRTSNTPAVVFLPITSSSEKLPERERQDVGLSERGLPRCVLKYLPDPLESPRRLTALVGRVRRCQSLLRVSRSFQIHGSH